MMTRNWMLAAVLVMAAGSACFGQEAEVTVRGTVVSWNKGPEGNVEGVIVQGDRGLVQFNMAGELAGQVRKGVAVGEKVEVEGRVGGGPGRDGRGPARDGRDGRAGRDGREGRGAATADHGVYELEQLMDLRGKVYAREEPGAGAGATVDGVVAAMNYNREGIVDGLQLANGDLVRLGPAGVSIAVRVGDHIVVEGRVRTVGDGSRVIEPETVNGVPVKKAPPGDRGDAPPPPPPGGDQGPGDQGPPDPNGG